jgi:hypothetical protein
VTSSYSESNKDCLHFRTDMARYPTLTLSADDDLSARARLVRRSVAHVRHVSQQHLTAAGHGSAHVARRPILRMSDHTTAKGPVRLEDKAERATVHSVSRVSRYRVCIAEGTV